MRQAGLVFADHTVGIDVTRWRTIRFTFHVGALAGA